MRLSKLDIKDGSLETRSLSIAKSLIGDHASSHWHLRPKSEDASAYQKELPILFSIEDDGFNLIVTLLKSNEPITLADVPMLENTPMVWLPEHELRIGDYFIFNQVVERDRSSQLQEWSFPGKGLIPAFALALLGAVILTALLRFISGQAKEVANSVKTFQPTATATLSQTATSTLTPTDTPIPNVTFVPMVTAISPLSETSKITVTLTPTPTLPITQTPISTATVVMGLVDGVAVTLERSTCVPEEKNWIPDRNTITGSLGISYTQAMIRPNYDFFTLYSIEWINEKDAGGRHNIYVDIRERLGTDENGNPIWHRVADRSILVSWAGGSCQRKIKDISNRNDHPWSDYGANCPMDVPGYAYSVQVFSPHSDVVSRLGLGTIPDPNQSVNLREFPILTSYLLVFEKKTTNCN